MAKKPSSSAPADNAAADNAAVNTPAAPAAPVPPVLDHDKVLMLAREPYRHHKTKQLVFYHFADWAFMATGIPIAPLTEEETAIEAEARKVLDEKLAEEKAAAEAEQKALNDAQIAKAKAAAGRTSTAAEAAPAPYTPPPAVS